MLHGNSDVIGVILSGYPPFHWPLGSSKINLEKELTNNFKTKSKGEIRTTVLRLSPFHFTAAISDTDPL